MELLDRYLAAVRSNLPAARANDITAELRGELLDRVEAREAALGRPLDRTETGELLKAFGRPVVVATRYREHQQLIGPEVYPFYLHALRVIAVIALAVFLFSAIVPIITGSQDFARAIPRALHNAWGALLPAFGIVTLVFAVVERTGTPRAWLSDWKPEQLPVNPQRRKSPWELPFDFGVSLFVLLWMLGVIPIPVAQHRNGLHIEPGDVWTQFYWPILGIVVAQLATSLIDWLRPAWSRLRDLLGVAMAIAGIALISLLLARGPWAMVTATTASAADAARAAAGINGAIRIALSIALIVTGIRLATALYRLFANREYR